ncbi:hypothetical protein PHYBOEH_008080 [Phytophthora boehmeriae]|uniref:HTH psq-type domain-containing protein n=1 Tax=Phytophthora boehmeriae TaxID=109152 RepID=A0A8T1X202_9STRA|nr:hypothetical protein PHYBOEH_008080 [Phytophthora boehmeriae]
MSSVARSLAAAAAALRASEWRGDDDDTSPWRHQEQLQMHDRYASYDELRARHWHLTQRQRLAREQEQEQWAPPRRDHRGRAALAAAVSHARSDSQSSGRLSDDQVLEGRPRPRVVVDGRRSFHPRHQPVPAAEAAGRRYKPAVDPPPATQLVASLVPRVGAPGTLDRRVGGISVDRTDAAVLRPSLIDVEKQVQTPPEGLDTASATEVRGPLTRSKTAAGTEHSLSATASSKSTAEDSGDSEDVVVDDDDTTEVRKKPKKRVRYLRDTDRRNIIKRIENGEKQAALAREFGVTRAAICHIKKNKDEILSRYNFLVKSAQEIDMAEKFTGLTGVDMMVYELRSNSVLLLMTMLRDSRSTGATFRRAAGRLILILLEEALAVVGTQSVEVVTGTGHLYQGLKLKHPFCGVAIGAGGFPFLVLFHQMEPQAPQGSIHVEMTRDRQGQRVWRLDHMDLPASITQLKILLFSSTCSTGEAECKAIDALCSVGCEESDILLVVILAAVDGVVAVSNHYPQVKIVTSAIDSKVDPPSQSIVPGFGDFMSRYNDV